MGETATLTCIDILGTSDIEITQATTILVVHNSTRNQIYILEPTKRTLGVLHTSVLMYIYVSWRDHERDQS